MAQRLGEDERVWLITGCSTGIGRAVAEQLVEQGGSVIATARRPETLDDLVAAGGDRVVVARLDLSDPTSIQPALDAGIDRFGRVDVLLSCAGTGLVGSVEESSDEEIDTVFQVNFFGTLKLVKAMLPHMRARSTGHIAVMTSFGAFEGHAGVGIYDASKFALNGLCEALAGEVEPLGIHVTIVEPGVVRTNFRAGNITRAKRRIKTYDSTVGARRAAIDGGYPPSANDPADVARALIAALQQPVPPLHLPLGKEAPDFVRGKLNRMLESISEWESYSRLAPPQDSLADQ